MAHLCTPEEDELCLDDTNGTPFPSLDLTVVLPPEAVVSVTSPASPITTVDASGCNGVTVAPDARVPPLLTEYGHDAAAVELPAEEFQPLNLDDFNTTVLGKRGAHECESGLLLKKIKKN